VPLDQGILATTPGTGCAPPSRPPAESCRAGRSDPDRGHGGEPRGPRHRLAGPRRRPRARHMGTQAGRCPPGR